MRNMRRSQKWRRLTKPFFSNSARINVVIRNPLRKKKIVTPIPPGTRLPRPAWEKNTSRKLMARMPSSDGIWRVPAAPAGCAALTGRTAPAGCDSADKSATLVQIPLGGPIETRLQRSPAQPERPFSPGRVQLDLLAHQSEQRRRHGGRHAVRSQRGRTQRELQHFERRRQKPGFDLQPALRNSPDGHGPECAPVANQILVPGRRIGCAQVEYRGRELRLIQAG